MGTEPSSEAAHVDLRNVVLDHGDASPFRLEIARLALARGEQVVLTGPSGCGKSTLLDAMAGLHIPRSGTVRVGSTTLAEIEAGQPPAVLPDTHRRRFRIEHIGFVFQTFELLEPLTVLENILLPFAVHTGLRLTPATRERASDLASRLGIDALLARLPAALSHGERQRTAIARALITEPELILADEPTGNLDPKTTHSILDLLQEEAARVNATLVVVTHDHTILARFGRHLDFNELTQGVRA